MTEKDLYTNLQSRLVAQTWTGSSNVVFPLYCVQVVPFIADTVVQMYTQGAVPFCLDRKSVV